MTPRLETERLILRLPEPADAAAWLAFYRGPRSADVGGPFDSPSSWARFAALIGHWTIRGFGRFVMVDKASGRAIGHAGTNRPDGWPENEIAWTLWADDAVGKGLASEAARATRDWAYDTLGWTTAVSYIRPGNVRSRAVAERLGARLDPAAARPEGYDLVVYRHPGPGARA